ncbi:unnamed protein product [Durusdinium trenchii]|uniref:Uncharacterized protein n=1 Tax=Durusdinium trenchii TaxID=1381693 RepID=A0ABP0L9S6_9DINO
MSAPASPASSARARPRPVGSPPGGRKKDTPARYQWLFERERLRDGSGGSLSRGLGASAGQCGRPGLTSPTSPPTLSSSPPSPHFPPQPRYMERANSTSILSLGHSSPTGVGSVLFSPLSDAASFLAKSAQLSMAKQDLRDVVFCCNQAVALGPDCSLAWKQRGLARLQLGDVRGALEDMDMAVQSNPTDARLLEGRAAARYGLRDFEGAVDDVTSALEVESLRPEMWQRRGLASVMLEDYASAAADYDKAVNLDPHDEATWRYRSVARLQLDDHRAEDDASQAVKLHPNAENYVQRARVRLERRKYEGAIRDCTEALRMVRDKAEIWFLRALAKNKLSDYMGAMTDLAQGIRCDPHTYQALETRAQIQLRQGRYEEVIEECSEVIPIMPEPAELLCCRGQAYFRKGHFRSALEDFQSSLQHEPNNVGCAAEACTQSKVAQRMLDKTEQSLKQLDSWKLRLGRSASFGEVVNRAELVNQ